MSAPETPRAIANEWMRHAGLDMQFARFGLSRSELQDMAAFHAQQAIEKALKAMCVLKQVPFEKTHDVARLLGVVEAFAGEFASRWQHLDRITEYAVTPRYPTDVTEYEVSPPEAVELAAQLLAAVEEWMDEQPET